jgi:hypothetical protein
MRADDQNAHGHPSHTGCLIDLLNSGANKKATPASRTSSPNCPCIDGRLWFGCHTNVETSAAVTAGSAEG